MKALAPGLSKPPKLRSLDFDGCEIPREACVALFEGLTGCAALSKLKCCRSKPGAAGCAALAKMLSEVPSKINPTHSSLSKPLHTLTSPSSPMFSPRPSTRDTGRPFHCSIELDDSEIGDAGVAALFPGLSAATDTRLQHLAIKESEIFADGVRCLVQLRKTWRPGRRWSSSRR